MQPPGYALNGRGRLPLPPLLLLAGLHRPWEWEQPCQPTDEGHGLRMLEQQERRKLDPSVTEPPYQPWTTVPGFYVKEK